MTTKPTIDGVSREAFEAANPVPFGIFWSEPDSRYMTSMVHLNCLEYQGKFAGWLSAQATIAQLEARLEIDPRHNIDGIDARDATIKGLDEQVDSLKARIAELERGHSEPVDRQYRYRTIYPLSEWSKWESINEASYKSLAANLEFKGWQNEVRELYIAPPAPVEVVLPERELLRDKIAEAIGGDTYDCTRVWSAWGVGTMDQDDFVPLVGQEDRLYEIVDACLDAIAALNGGSKA